MILAIDPGPTESAYVELGDCDLVFSSGKVPNSLLLSWLRSGFPFDRSQRLYCEMIASYGMPVGKEVFDTCVWIGRFAQAWDPESNGTFKQVYRKDVKLHLCHSLRANDAAIRHAILDRYGGKAKAVGTKRAMGPLYNIKSDMWQALAVALTAYDIVESKLV